MPLTGFRSERVRPLRKNRRLSQEDVARRANISLNTVIRLETGKTPDPHISTIRALSHALDVSIHEFIYE